jgi:hypothetical protein
VRGDTKARSRGPDALLEAYVSYRALNGSMMHGPCNGFEWRVAEELTGLTKGEISVSVKSGTG